MLVFGEEPFQIDKYRKEIRKKVKVPELDLLETSEFTENEKQFLSQYSLFGDE
jgi:DNA polymerase III delta subunit